MTRMLRAEYRLKKKAIKERLKEFRSIWRQPDSRIFCELCFCICTPQSKAVYCDRAVSALERSGVLFKGNVRQIRAGLTAVRFPNNKARFIVETRTLFCPGRSLKIKDKINTRDIPATRDWLVKNVKGIGYKEASHFLRNIGLGKGLAILDVHILKNMVKYGVIKDVPKSVSKAIYLKLEGKLEKFSHRIGIPMEELDLLFWSMETGMIFK
jgi:N-glycosylase/DNA lyase